MKFFKVSFEKYVEFVVEAENLAQAKSAAKKAVLDNAKASILNTEKLAWVEHVVELKFHDTEDPTDHRVVDGKLVPVLSQQSQEMLEQGFKDVKEGRVSPLDLSKLADE